MMAGSHSHASRAARFIANGERAKTPLGQDKRVRHALSLSIDRKALNVVILDVVGKVDYTDYVVVMSGRSDRQVERRAPV